MSRPQAHQIGGVAAAAVVRHPNSNINLDEVGEGESLESKIVLPDDFDDVIKDMVSVRYYLPSLSGWLVRKIGLGSVYGS